MDLQCVRTYVLQAHDAVLVVHVVVRRDLVLRELGLPCGDVLLQILKPRLPRVDDAPAVLPQVAVSSREVLVTELPEDLHDVVNAPGDDTCMGNSLCILLEVLI